MEYYNHHHSIGFKKPFLTGFAVAIITIITAFIIGIALLQKHNLDKSIKAELQSVQLLFSRYLDLEAEYTDTIIDHFEADMKLQKAFASRDRQQLLQLAQPIFSSIRSKHNITHFYFIAPDKTCFLRVHNPDRHTDSIDRYTLNKAVTTGKEAHGIELGTFGTFTLRVVEPWIINNKIAGYLELGKEIDHITPELNKILGCELFFLVDKKNLSHEDWLEGLNMTGRTGKWDEVPDHVVVDRTLPLLPAKLIDYVMRIHAGEKNLALKVSLDNKKFRGGSIELKDAGGLHVGEIIALRDYSRQESEQMLTIITFAICIFIAVVAFFLFYHYTENLENSLKKIYRSLTAEIDCRIKMGEKLKKNEEELEKKVAQRTVALKETNVLLQEQITERRSAEKALQSVNEALEQRVEERSKELQKTHKQLLHVEKLSAVGKLSASIAHEFNNPLYGVMNVLNSVRNRADLTPCHAEMITLALAECDRMKNLIRDLQDFNRPTSGRPVSMDLHQTLNNILLLSKKELKSKKIHLQKNYADSLPPITAVPDQIKQVFLNLLNNAIDACDKEDIISINTEQRDDLVVLQVMDTGSGIRPDIIDRIFDPFFSTKTAAKGTGLGLSVTYGIIKRHGGRIEVESEEGKGTRITVILPRDGIEDKNNV